MHGCRRNRSGQWPRLLIRNTHQHSDSKDHRFKPLHSTHWAHKFEPQNADIRYTFPPSARSHRLPREPRTFQSISVHYPVSHPLNAWDMVGCLPSCRCPGGRCLPARSGGCSRARSPLGCHCRRSRASTPESRIRKSTVRGGRHRPGGAARVARGAVKGPARRVECSGLRTPVSWCRAQGRARTASGAGLRRGHGHLAWHL